MAEPIDPSDVRHRVIDELGNLPAELHLDALHAIDHGQVEVDLSEPDVVRIVLGDRVVIDVPTSQWYRPDR